MNKLLTILFLALIGSEVFSQTDSATINQPDTAEVVKVPKLPSPVKKRQTADFVRQKKVVDTLTRTDSVKPFPRETTTILDSLGKNMRRDSPTMQAKRVEVKRPIDTFYRKLLDNPFLRSTSKPIFLVIKERQRNSKDEMFYLVAGLLLFLAFIKLVFSRYFQNLFRLFFQPSFRQKQTREQLQQGNLPSLLLNLFFVFSAAAYISFLFSYYHITEIGFWWLFLYSSLSLLLLYTGKYIFLSFAGWVFNVKETTDAYIFAISLINRILGVILVPFTMIIAFSYPDIINVSITISILVILILFLYRYLVSYPAVRKEIKVSPLHFLFYVLAFEIVPLLLIYKTLMLYLNKSL